MLNYQSNKIKKVFIYSLSTKEEPDIIRYIGKANVIEDRMFRHLQPYYLNEGTYKANWLKSELKKGHTPIIKQIDEVLESEWEFWEQFWIAQFKAWGFNLTNGTHGGEGFGITIEVISKRNVTNFNRNTIKLKDDISKFNVKQEDDLWIAERKCPKCNNILQYKYLTRTLCLKAVRKGYNKNRTCLNCRDCIKNLGKYYQSAKT